MNTIEKNKKDARYKQNLIKKVRKEIKTNEVDNIFLGTFFGDEISLKPNNLKGVGSDWVQKEYQKLFLKEKTEEKNHAITLIIVWLAILTVLAIYVSIK